MTNFSMLIGAELVRGDRWIDVINPATQDVIARAPVASARQLDAAVAAAHAALADWSVRPVEERQSVVAAMADIIERNAGDIARILTEEQGKPLQDALGEVHAAVAIFRHFATLSSPLASKVDFDGEGRRIEYLRRPLGVVGAIVPWNFPLTLMAFKTPAALVAGNTVVLKPAPTTPLSTLRVGELLQSVAPPGVLNILADDGTLGPLLTQHPGIRKVSFTGSTDTGQRVMASAASTLKRVTLELGGNDAAIVLDDVDPDEIAPKIFYPAFHNAGQICIAIKRLYVHERVYDRMCDALAALADAMVVGNGLSPGVEMGPLQNRSQFEKVKDLIEDARRVGRIATKANDGAIQPGFFIRPTVVRDIEDGARLVDEEQFGPVLPVIRFQDEVDAVARANASRFGLGASVWSSDGARALALARHLNAGTIWINKHADLSPGIPFGGAGMSGVGTELGDLGLNEFTQLHVINGAAAAAS